MAGPSASGPTTMIPLIPAHHALCHASTGAGVWVPPLGLSPATQRSSRGRERQQQQQQKQASIGMPPSLPPHGEGKKTVKTA